MQATRMLNWFDQVWHTRRENAVEELLHPQAVIHGLNTDPDKKGHEAFKPFYENFCKDFPKINVEVTPIFVNDEIEVINCEVTGEDAAGHNVHFTGICIGKFEDGKLIEGWNGFDFITMYDQIGYKLVKQPEEEMVS
jgi:predicted ester cyclase